MLGVVLQTYGCGNAPNNRDDLITEIKKATGRGVLIINCTQCLHGPVVDQYATGKVRSPVCACVCTVQVQMEQLQCSLWLVQYWTLDWAVQAQLLAEVILHVVLLNSVGPKTLLLPPRTINGSRGCSNAPNPFMRAELLVPGAMGHSSFKSFTFSIIHPVKN